MPRTFRRIIALCLALVWGPVTLCCALEAAGVTPPCCDSHCEDEAGPVDAGSCSLVEEGKYQSGVAATKVPAPALAGGWLLCVLVPDTAPAEPPLPAQVDKPRDWLPDWQFERRAAAPAHAPDSLNA